MNVTEIMYRRACECVVCVWVWVACMCMCCVCVGVGGIIMYVHACIYYACTGMCTELHIIQSEIQKRQAYDISRTCRSALHLCRAEDNAPCSLETDGTSPWPRGG